MWSLFQLVALRHLRARPLRAALTTAGVMFGVALYIAIEIINRSTLASYSESIQTVAGHTTLAISAGATGFDEAKLELARAVPGVSYAVGMVETAAHFSGPGGAHETLVVLGVDLLDEHSVWSQSADNPHIVRNALSFLNRPDSIILTQSFADQHALQTGASLELATAKGKGRFTVRGILSPDGPSRAYGGGLAVMDIDAARLAFGKQGRLDRIDVVTDEGQDVDAVAVRLRDAYGPGFRVERPESQASKLQNTIRPFQLMLALFSSLALLVGLFLVANSIGMSVAQRRFEIGTLRALGATRKMIALVFLLEAGVIGVIGSFLGAALGRIAASTLVEMVSQTISKQARVPLEVSSLSYPASQFFGAVGLGTLIALASALLPSVRAVAIGPLEAMGRDKQGSARTGRAGLLAVCGALCLLYLQISSTLGIGSRSPVLAILDPVLGIVGALLLGPWLALFVIGRIGAPLARAGGALTRLALGQILRNRARTAGNVINVMVGLLLVMMLATINASFKGTLLGSYGNAVRPDLLVSSSADLSDDQSQPFDEAIIARAAQTPGVSGAYGMRKIPITYEGRSVTLKAFDEPDPSIHYGIYEMRDRPIAEAGEELYHAADDTVFVSENFSLRFHKKTGDHLELETPSGVKSMRIVGVEIAPAVSGGLISISRVRYKKFWHDPLVNMFAVQIPSVAGQDPVARVKEALDNGMGRELGLSVTSQAGVKEQISDVIDRSFRSTHAVEAAALLVGFLGLLNTLLVSVMERRRELGMLRAIGMARGQVYGMMLREAALQGVCAALIAVAFGLWISYLWTTHSMAAQLGWSVRFSFPLGWVLVTLGLGIFVTLAASFAPAWQASNLQIREALGYE